MEAEAFRKKGGSGEEKENPEEAMINQFNQPQRKKSKKRTSEVLDSSQSSREDNKHENAILKLLENTSVQELLAVTNTDKEGGLTGSNSRSSASGGSVSATRVTRARVQKLYHDDPVGEALELLQNKGLSTLSTMSLCFSGMRIMYIIYHAMLICRNYELPCIFPVHEPWR